TEEGGFQVDGATLAPGALGEWIEEHATTDIGLHVRGTWGGGTGRVDGVALASSAGQAAYVEVAELTLEDEQALARWLADESRGKFLHDAKGPILALAAQGWGLEGLRGDTALSAYLERPDHRSYNLADLTVRYLRRELKEESDEGQGLLFAEDDAVADLAMLRARAVLDLAEALAVS